MQIAAPAAWAEGYTSAGIVVGVIDTGIDSTHPDLAGKVIAQRSFVDFDPNPSDTIGHGTHVASTIAGTGAASGGKYRGVAPDAQLVSGKACHPLGCPFSSTVAAMEWPVTEAGATVINMSLGGADTPDIDPQQQASPQTALLPEDQQPRATGPGRAPSSGLPARSDGG